MASSPEFHEVDPRGLQIGGYWSIRRQLVGDARITWSPTTSRRNNPVHLQWDAVFDAELPEQLVVGLAAHPHEAAMDRPKMMRCAQHDEVRVVVAAAVAVVPHVVQMHGGAAAAQRFTGANQQSSTGPSTGG